MLKNIQTLVEYCLKNNMKISDVMLEFEVNKSQKSKSQILSYMQKHYEVMKNSAKKGLEGVVSHSGISGGDAKKLDIYIKKGIFLTDPTLLKAINYAISINEVNAAMGVVCATPTAGSAGVLPACVIALSEKLNISDEVAIKHIFCAGAIGYIIANNAFISGAAGGCQAEVGSASAMAAATLVEMMGGDVNMCVNAAAIALKNMLGLACDPVAGLVEVPCIKRNAGGVSVAFCAAEMALAGIVSKIPPDEVIDAMYKIGIALPLTLKESAMGGLADTKTGRELKQKLWKNIKRSEDEL